jgi:hypothetical protein
VLEAGSAGGGAMVAQICWWVMMMMSVGGRECQQGTRTTARNLQIEREEVDDWFLSAKRHDKKHKLCTVHNEQSPPSPLMPWTVFEGSSCMVSSL